MQQSPPQHQRATDFSAGPAGSSFEEASSREPQDAPLLLINPAQLSRSSSQTVPSPTVMQPSAPSSQAWATDTAVAAAATATTPEGHLPLVGGAVSGLPGTLPSAHALPPTAALQPQGSSTTDLLAAVNAVAGRLSLRHTASQSSYARLPSISEASAAACEEAPAVLAQQQGGAAADVSGSPHGLMFSVAAPGFRRTISNLRTGGPVTASLAADSPRMASLSRQTSQGMRLPANQLQGRVHTRQQDFAAEYTAVTVVAAASRIVSRLFGWACFYVLV